ncbi:MAG: hypothetical protein Q9222_004221 [Ikaeria aurantiellina]
MTWLVNALFVLAPFAAFLWWKVHVPFNLPKDLPTVPIYVSLLGLWSNLGQDEIYDRWLRKPLEEHGAVRFWFAGQWSILVTKPRYLMDLFRNEHVYAKAGNHKKIPGTVMANLLGDNIISSHGENWRLYTSIMKPGLTKRDFDCRPLVNTSRKLAKLLLQAQMQTTSGNGVLINPFILRYAITVMGQSFLDTDFRCLDDPKNEILDLQMTIKQSIFKPLFLNFPFLDKFSALIPSRQRAFSLVRQFELLLCNLVQNRPQHTLEKGINTNSEQVIHLLERARKEGKITEKQYRDNLKIIFIVAHENTQLLLNSMFYEIGKNEEVQSRLRTEIDASKTLNPTASTVNKLPYLTSVIYELLRLYPPISQLANRQSNIDSLLGDEVPIPAGTYLAWNAYGVQTSTANWGPRAREFIPERWGSNVEEMQLKFRRETIRGTFIPFNAHTRKCLGQGFVLLQMKIALFELVRSLKWKVDPEYKFKLPGGGVLAPVGCKIIFEEIQTFEEMPETAACDNDITAYDGGDLEASSYQSYGPHNESHDCTKALDNNATSFWLTKYYPAPDPLPHNYNIDMQTLLNITSLSYLPRQDNSNIGNILQWKIALSADNQDWRRFFGTWSSDPALKTFDFGEQVEARWVILTAYTSAGSPGNRTNAAEIRVYDTNDSAARKTMDADPAAATATRTAGQVDGKGKDEDTNPLGKVGTAFTVLGGLAALGTLVWSVLRFCVKWKGTGKAQTLVERR